MVYVARDGTVCESMPFGLDKILRIIYGLIGFVIYFFQSLVGLDTSSSRRSGSHSSGSSSWRGSGSGGGGGGGSRGPGNGPDGRPKRFFTMRDINPPTIGGCPGGSCPR